MGIDVSSSVNRDFLPVGRGGKVFLNMDITPSPDERGDRPLNLCFLIDASGSMSGDKIDYAKSGALKVVEKLEESDYASLITFSGDGANVIVGGSRHISDPDSYRKEIEKISAGGGTPMYSGLESAFSELKKGVHTQYGPGQGPIRKVLLLTDGKPTDVMLDKVVDRLQGWFSEGEGEGKNKYAQLAERMQEQGISIIALGIGDYDEKYLQLLSKYSNGYWDHLSSPADIEEVFQNELKELQTVVRANPKLIVQPIRDVELEEIFQVSPRKREISPDMGEERKYEVPLSDIKEAESQTYTARLAVPPKEEETQYMLAKVMLHGEGEAFEERVVIEFTSNEEKLGLQAENTVPRERHTAIKTAMKVKGELTQGRETEVKEETENYSDQLARTVLRDATEAAGTDVKDEEQRKKTIAKELGQTEIRG